MRVDLNKVRTKYFSKKITDQGFLWSKIHMQFNNGYLKNTVKMQLMNPTEHLLARHLRGQAVIVRQSH